MSLFDLSGQVAIVTGATKGIGLGIAQQMAAQGARVIVSSRNAAQCDEVAADISRQYGKGAQVAKGLACDLDNLDDIERLAAEARTVWGRVDHLVCNAAVLPYFGAPATTPPEVFDRILSSNIHHNVRLCEAVRPDIAKQGGGSITLIGSIAGHTAMPFLLAYAAAKAGLAHVARCLAEEMAVEGIRVNCVAPGLIRSASSTSTMGDEGLKQAGAGIPLRRVGEPEDIAGAVIFLASQAGSYVTGGTILVDGGRAFLPPVNQANPLKAHEGETAS